MELDFDFKKTILVIPDMHGPYHHKDSLRFLAAVKRKFNPRVAISLGDLIDNHGISFHKSDPDLHSAGKELDLARAFCRKLEKMFPRLTIIGSNHGDLPLRKFLEHGLPRGMLRPYNEIYGVSEKWRFVDELTLSDSKTSIYFVHGITKNATKVVMQRGLNVVCGHFHTEFRIDYISNPSNLLWALQSGCLIDKVSLAFAYNKVDLQRPIIGASVIVNGLPHLIPMVLNKSGRWIGRLL